MMTLSGLISLVKKQLLYLPLGLLLALPAHAIFIDFDDLESVQVNPTNISEARSLADKYLDQGLQIDGYLGSWEGSAPERIVSQPNYLLVGYSGSLVFVEKFPVFVSMYVTVLSGEAGFLKANGPGDWTSLQQTPGNAGAFTQPYQEKNFVSFYRAEGIRAINMWSYNSTPLNMAIDDLTYEYSVPEPSPLILLAASLLALVLKTSRIRKNT